MSYDWRLYHCPFIPSRPTDCVAYDSAEQAQEQGRLFWPEAWILAQKGTELDGLLHKSLANLIAEAPQEMEHGYTREIGEEAEFERWCASCLAWFHEDAGEEACPGCGRSW